MSYETKPSLWTGKERRLRSLLTREDSTIARVQGVRLPVHLNVCVSGHFNNLASGGIPALSAFSRKKHAGAAVSPTSKLLK